MAALPQIAVVVAALVWLLAPSAQRITSGWLIGVNAEFAHGIPVALLALWLFLRLEPARTEQWTRERTFALLAIIALCSLMWLLGSVIFVNTIQDLAFFALCVTAVTLILRPASLVQAAAPAFVLALTLPEWRLLYPMLQDIAVAQAVPLLNLTGTPAIADGYRIMVPVGDFVVDPGCGGLGEILAALAVATVFAHLERLRPVVSALFVTGAAIVAVIMNAFRVVLVVSLGGVLGMEHRLVQDHDWAGWVMFAIGMTAYLIWFTRVLKRRPHLAHQDRAVGQERQTGSEAYSVARGWRYAALGLTLAAFGPALAALTTSDGHHRQELAFTFPGELAGWSLVHDGQTAWNPAFSGADLSSVAHYREADGNDVYVYVAFYGHQAQGREAVSYDNVPYDRKVWRAVGSTRIRDVGAATRPRAVEQTKLRSAIHGDLLAWQWFYTDTLTTGNRLQAKLLSVWPAIRGDTSMGSIIIAADVASAKSEPDQTLERFLRVWNDREPRIASADGATE